MIFPHRRGECSVNDKTWTVFLKMTKHLSKRLGNLHGRSLSLKSFDKRPASRKLLLTNLSRESTKHVVPSPPSLPLFLPPSFLFLYLISSSSARSLSLTGECNGSLTTLDGSAHFGPQTTDLFYWIALIYGALALWR